MARTAAKAAQSDVFPSGTRLAFTHAGYDYRLSVDESGVAYAVAKDGESLSARLAWAFGDGKVGQSFLFERDGAYHEARVSYYDSIHALDFTPARGLEEPHTLGEAMSRRISDAEIRRCFACHTTAATTDGRFDAAAAVPGITCEACHGPGRPHVDAVAARRMTEAKAALLNPKRLDPADSVDFCGACHSTFWDVKLADERGIAALRSQPYRLQSSRCWNGGDARLTCVTCHNPHTPLVGDSGSYDARCLACHVGRGAEPNRDRPVRACRVADVRCSSCHMPKYDVPGMHHEFTDHLIRVVASRR
jgi:hypothetical protein